jgi:hypothetical protein
MDLLDLPIKIGELKRIEQEVFALQTLVSFELETPELLNEKMYVRAGSAFIVRKRETVNSEKKLELEELIKKRNVLRQDVSQLQTLLQQEKSKLRNK